MMGKNKINIKTENLAVPEIIVDDNEPDFESETNSDNNIEYENLAIPEFKSFDKKNK